MDTMPLGSPVFLSVWKKSMKAFPLTPSGISAGKRSTLYWCFILIRPSGLKSNRSRFQFFRDNAINTPAKIIIARNFLIGNKTAVNINHLQPAAERSLRAEARPSNNDFLWAVYPKRSQKSCHETSCIPGGKLPLGRNSGIIL